MTSCLILLISARLYLYVSTAGRPSGVFELIDCPILEIETFSWSIFRNTFVILTQENRRPVWKLRDVALDFDSCDITRNSFHSVCIVVKKRDVVIKRGELQKLVSPPFHCVVISLVHVPDFFYFRHQIVLDLVCIYTQKLTRLCGYEEILCTSRFA